MPIEDEMKSELRPSSGFDPARIVIRQYGRSWWSVYTRRGRFLATGKTKREALEKAKAK